MAVRVNNLKLRRSALGCDINRAQQISQTDPDARYMATSGRGSGMVGYNVQTGDAKRHLCRASYSQSSTDHPPKLRSRLKRGKRALGSLH